MTETLAIGGRSFFTRRLQPVLMRVSLMPKRAPVVRRRAPWCGRGRPWWEDLWGWRPCSGSWMRGPLVCRRLPWYRVGKSCWEASGDEGVRWWRGCYLSQEGRGGRPCCRGGNLWYGGERPGVEEGALVWRTASRCGGGRPSEEESALVWRRVPRCRGGRPGVEEGALVWMRMPLARRGWRTRFGGGRL